MKTVKRVIAILVLILFSTMVFAQKKQKIKGDKDVVTTTNTMQKGFNAIEIDDALEVNLVQGASNSYVLTTDKNLQSVIRFSVNDSVLKIYTTDKITSSKKLEINLSFVNLEHITIKNDAKAKGEGRFVSKVMYINAYNSSKLELDVEAEEVIVTMQRNAGGKLNVSSTNTTMIMTDRTDLKASVIADKTTVTLTKSAQLNLSGDSHSVAFNLKDASKLDAQKMKTSSADLYTSNNSDVHVYAGKNLELYAQGKSNIYVYGNPKIEVKGLTDNSKIIKK